MADSQIGLVLKITQWVPSNEPPRWPCVNSWMEARLTQNLPKGCEEIGFIRSLSETDEKLRPWNEAVEKFLESDSEWLFSTHNDVIFDPQTLTRLLSWDKLLISALVFMRQSPVIPHVWKSYEDDSAFINRIDDTRDWFFDHLQYIKFGQFVMDPKPDDALVEVGFTSTACTLIHRSILEKMGSPWFTMDSYRGGGEDRRFYQKARELGFKGYVDRSCVAGHLVGDVATSSIDFMMWSQSSEYKNTGQIAELEEIQKQ